nr:MAG TPA: hypothetical protein [Caudoviricetes sp.]
MKVHLLSCNGNKCRWEGLQPLTVDKEVICYPVVVINASVKVYNP